MSNIRLLENIVNSSKKKTNQHIYTSHSHIVLYCENLNGTADGDSKQRDISGAKGRVVYKLVV